MTPKSKRYSAVAALAAAIAIPAEGLRQYAYYDPVCYLLQRSFAGFAENFPDVSRGPCSLADPTGVVAALSRDHPPADTLLFITPIGTP